MTSEDRNAKSGDPETSESPIRPWRLQLSCSTDLVLPQSLEFDLSVLNIRVVQRTAVNQALSSYTFPNEEVREAIGLRFDVRTSAFDWDRACTLSESACGAISKALAVVHHTAVTLPRFDGMIDVAPGDGPRTLIQCLHSMDRPSRSAPRFDARLVSEFLNRLSALGDASVRSQVDRAMFHLQASYTDDPVTQFSELWIGIAALNELLKDKFEIESIRVRCVHCGAQTLYCTSCSKQHIQTHRETAVARGIILGQMGRARDEWNKVNRLRQRIMHGTGDVPSQEEALAAAATLRKAVSIAITIALGLPAERAEVFAPPRIPVRGDDDLWVVAQLEKLPLLEIADSDVIPEFRIARGGFLFTLEPNVRPVPVPLAMYGYRGSYAPVRWFVQPGSMLLQEIQPAFVTGGAPGEGSYG